MNMLMPGLKRIGYHRLSDDSVTSFCVPKSATPAVLDGLRQNWDVDLFWTRDDNEEVDYKFDKLATITTCKECRNPKENCICRNVFN